MSNITLKRNLWLSVKDVYNSHIFVYLQKHFLGIIVWKEVWTEIEKH